jgi:hypothetical protein
LGQSVGTFCAVSKQSNRLQVICNMAMSEIGVMRLNFLLTSKRIGMYLSNKTERIPFSV